jgi:hypothetical protein
MQLGLQVFAVFAKNTCCHLPFRVMQTSLMGMTVASDHHCAGFNDFMEPVMKLSHFGT